MHDQKYHECQLISALNAYYYLTGKVYCEQYSQEYEDLVDLCKARNGAPLSIKRVYDKIGLTVLKKSDFLWGFVDPKKLPFNTGKLPLPIEIRISHRLSLNHSVLVVDHIIKCNAVRVTNFDIETREGWIFLSDLYLYSNPLKDFKLLSLK